MLHTLASLVCAASHSCMQVNDINQDTIHQEIFETIPADLWSDAKMKEVVEYLYANKSLDLTNHQRQLLREVSKAFV